MISRRCPFLPEASESRLRAWMQSSPPVSTIGKFENAVCDAVGVQYGVAVNSGRHGMELILRHLKLGPGDDVIIPAYTIEDLIPLIQNLGARVVLADIEPFTFNIDPARVAERITERTKAILVLHIFGSPCAVEQIQELARPRGIAVIEDCAHALGTRIGDRQAGAFGDASFYSFETTKTLNTLGGGLVVSGELGVIDSVRTAMAANRPSLETVQEKIKAIRMERFLFRSGLGWPMLYLLASKVTGGLMTALYRQVQHAPPSDIQYMPVQAQLGLEALPSLPERLAHRNRMAERYRALLDPSIQTQGVRADATSTWYFYVVKLPVPAAPVRLRLLWRGIDAGVAWEIADDCGAVLHDPECPVARDVYTHALALPMYDGITEATVTRVAQVLNRVLR